MGSEDLAEYAVASNRLLLLSCGAGESRASVFACWFLTFNAKTNLLFGGEGGSGKGSSKGDGGEPLSTR